MYIKIQIYTLTVWKEPEHARPPRGRGLFSDAAVSIGTFPTVTPPHSSLQCANPPLPRGPLSRSEPNTQIGPFIPVSSLNTGRPTKTKQTNRGGWGGEGGAYMKMASVSPGKTPQHLLSQSKSFMFLQNKITGLNQHPVPDYEDSPPSNHKENRRLG